MKNYREEELISYVKSAFAKKISDKLQLIKVEAPLLVEQGTGVNDDLSGTENAVAVKINDIPERVRRQTNLDFS